MSQTNTNTRVRNTNRNQYTGRDKRDKEALAAKATAAVEAIVGMA